MQKGLFSHQFTPDDEAFLARMFVVYPEIAEKFERYLAMAPEDRLAAAQRDATQIPRAGWVKRQIPNPESIAEHMQRTSARLAEILPPAQPMIALV